VFLGQLVSMAVWMLRERLGREFEDYLVPRTYSQEEIETGMTQIYLAMKSDCLSIEFPKV